MPASPPPDAPAAPVLTRRQYHALLALGSLAVVLVLVNGTLFVRNRATQDDVNARATYVQQTLPLQQLQTDIARSLADLALKSHDRQVLDMLAANGVTVTPNAAPDSARP